MPDVRSDEDCRRLIATLEKPVYRGCFTLIYAYGLRITEAVTLPVSAIDSKQMVLRIVGKRNKERILPLTEPILLMLRDLWKIHRNPRWLFPSRRPLTSNFRGSLGETGGPHEPGTALATNMTVATPAGGTFRTGST